MAASCAPRSAMGGKGGRNATLNKFRTDSEESLHGLLQLLDSPAPREANQVARNQYIALSDKVSKEATKVAIFWNTPLKDVGNGILVMQELVDSTSALLLHLHGSTTDAGKSLLNALKSRSTTLVDAVLGLINGAIESSSKGFDPAVRQSTLPKLAGRVWEACEDVKKSPPNNRSAIGRSFALYASSVKDVVREIGEMNAPEEQATSSNSENLNAVEGGNATSSPSTQAGSDQQPHQADEAISNHVEPTNGIEDDFDYSLRLEDDYTEVDMKVIHAAKDMCQDVFLLIKQLVYVVAKWPFETVPGTTENSPSPVESMESILDICKDFSFHVDEIGACLYPPQELETLKMRCGALNKSADELMLLTSSPPAAVHVSFDDSFHERVNGLRTSSERLLQILDALEHNQPIS